MACYVGRAVSGIGSRITPIRIPVTRKEHCRSRRRPWLLSSQAGAPLLVGRFSTALVDVRLPHLTYLRCHQAQAVSWSGICEGHSARSRCVYGVNRHAPRTG